MRKLRILQLTLWAAALIVTLSFGLYGIAALAPGKVEAPEIPKAASEVGGPFRLTSHAGKTITDADLRGKPSMVFFGFTYCPEICPTTLFDMSKLLQELGPDGDAITPVFITVDPERDTRAVLAEYLTAFDPRIVGLTGTTEEVDTAVRAYRAYYRKVPTSAGNYTMDHTAIVYLMDAKGELVSSLDRHEPEEARSAKVRRLIGQSQTTAGS